MDDELRRVLRRVEPPAGFAARVLQRAAAKPRAAKSGATTSHWRLAVAATLVAAIGGGAWYRAEETRKEGEDAKRQVLFSLSLAGSKLRSVEMKVNHEQER